MVRKGIVRSRASHGIIRSKNQLNDRARTVSHIFKTFSSQLPKDGKVKMINFSTKVLKVCEKDAFFSGKDPFISGITVFVFSCRRFSYPYKCPVTFREIRERVGHFASSSSFYSMLDNLSKKFP